MEGQAPLSPYRSHMLKRMGSIERLPRSVATGEGIKNLILTQGLQPGDPLPSEQELIDALGVSRSSVREAMRHLLALDIVAVKHGSGTYVGNLSMNPLVEALAFRAEMTAGADRSTLAEVVEVRKFLDQGTAAHVCSALKGTDQDDLREVVTEMIDLAEDGQVFTELDFAFHDGLLAQAGNEVVRQLVNSLWRVHQIVLPQLSPDVIRSRLAETARSHQALLDAAITGDVPAYLEGIEAHYRPIIDIISQGH